MAGTATASAQVFPNNYRPPQEMRINYRARITALRAEIASDRAALARHRRMGNRIAVERDLRELARDQRELSLLQQNGRGW